EERVAADGPATLVALVGRPAVEQHAEHVAVRLVPVGGRHLRAVGPEPRDVLDALRHRRAAEEATTAGDRGGAPERADLARELEQLAPRAVEAPVDPARLVVLAVGVVVARLRPSHLVAGREHGHALRAGERREEIPLRALAVAQHLDGLRRTLVAPVL